MQYVSELHRRTRPRSGRARRRQGIRCPGARRRGLSGPRRCRPQASQGRHAYCSLVRAQACSTTAALAVDRPGRRRRPSIRRRTSCRSRARSWITRSSTSTASASCASTTCSWPPADGAYRLVGVDISTAGLLRRLGAGRVLERARREAHAQGHRLGSHRASRVRRRPGVKLKVSHEDLAKLHPSDIAQIISQLDQHHVQEVLETLDDEAAADAHRRGQPRPAGALHPKAWSPSAPPTSSKRWTPTMPPTSSATWSPNERATCSAAWSPTRPRTCASC